MENDKIRMIFIKPGKVPAKIKESQDLKTLQTLVGGYIECVYPWNEYDVALICNEEAKLVGLMPNRGLTYGDLGATDHVDELYDLICGPFIIAGCGDDGDFRSLTDEEIEFFSERFKYPEIFARTSNGIRRIFDKAAGPEL